MKAATRWPPGRTAPRRPAEPPELRGVLARTLRHEAHRGEVEGAGRIEARRLADPTGQGVLRSREARGCLAGNARRRTASARPGRRAAGAAGRRCWRRWFGGHDPAAARRGEHQRVQVGAGAELQGDTEAVRRQVPVEGAVVIDDRGVGRVQLG